MSDWKPGDVARVTARWIRTDSPSERYAVRRIAGWFDTSGIGVQDHEVSAVRSLVVIDPEDAEQVTRLIDLACFPRSSAIAEDVRHALREFANPTPPKPNEPTGRYAVVVDSSGDEWVNIPDATRAPWRRDGYTFRTYSKVDAVRVLSEGVES